VQLVMRGSLILLFGRWSDARLAIGSTDAEGVELDDAAKALDAAEATMMAAKPPRMSDLCMSRGPFGVLGFDRRRGGLELAWTLNACLRARSD